MARRDSHVNFRLRQSPSPMPVAIIQSFKGLDRRKRWRKGNSLALCWSGAIHLLPSDLMLLVLEHSDLN
jgi:hypothetical protein